MARYQLGSPAWVDTVHGLVRKLLDGADLSGIAYASSEEYLNPPPELDRPGGVGWHMIVREGRLTLGHGPYREADRVVEADYRAIEPLASIPFSGNPEGEAFVRTKAVEMAAKGLLKARGDQLPSSVLPALSALHDQVASITAPASAGRSE